MAFCRNCGVELKEEERFCPNCGTSINETIPAVQASTKVSIDTQKLEDGFKRTKDAFIKLMKNPFRGAQEAHELLNSYASCMFAVILSLVYGLAGLWTKAAITEQLKKPFKGPQAFKFITNIISSAFKANNGKTFWLVFVTVILSIAIIFVLLFLVSNIILKQNQDITKLLNAAIFPFSIFLAVILLENIALYISLILYVILAVLSIILLIAYLYHNISLVMSNDGETSAAAYTSALSFVCTMIIYNTVLLKGMTLSLTNYLQSMLKNLI